MRGWNSKTQPPDHLLNHYPCNLQIKIDVFKEARATRPSVLKSGSGGWVRQIRNSIQQSGCFRPRTAKSGSGFSRLGSHNVAACICVRLGAPRQCGRVRNGITRERARNVFGETCRIVGLSDRRIVGPVPGIFGVTQTCVFTMSSRAFLGFGARVFWGLARRRAHRRITAYVDAYRRISAHIGAYLRISSHSTHLHQTSPSTVCVTSGVARFNYTENPRAHGLGDFWCKCRCRWNG